MSHPGGRRENEKLSQYKNAGWLLVHAKRCLPNMQKWTVCWLSLSGAFKCSNNSWKAMSFTGFTSIILFVFIDVDIKMLYSKNNIKPKCDIKTEGRMLNKVTNLKYPGVIITSDGRCTTGVTSRIGKANNTFQKNKNILCNKLFSLKIRKRLQKCYFEPVLL